MYQSHLEKLSRTRLDDVLLDEGVLARPHLQDAQAEQELTGKTLSSILLDRSALDEWDLAKLICTHYSLPFVDISDMSLANEEEDVLPVGFCTEHNVLPLERFGATFTLAVCEMPSPELLDEIIERSGLTPFLYVAVRRQIREMLGSRARRKGVSAHDQVVADALHGPIPERIAADSTDPGMQVSVSANEALSAIEAFSANFGQSEDGLIPIAGLPLVDLSLSASVHIRSSADSSLEHSQHGSQDGSQGDGPADRSWESIFDMGNDAVRGP